MHKKKDVQIQGNEARQIQIFSSFSSLFLFDFIITQISAGDSGKNINAH